MAYTQCMHCMNGKWSAFIQHFYPKWYTIDGSHLSIYTHTHTPTAIGCHARDQLVGSNWGFVVLLRDTSTDPGRGIELATLQRPPQLMCPPPAMTWFSVISVRYIGYMSGGMGVFFMFCVSPQRGARGTHTLQLEGRAENVSPSPCPSHTLLAQVHTNCRNQLEHHLLLGLCPPHPVSVLIQWPFSFCGTLSKFTESHGTPL